jgi:hypothetical protein
MYVMYPIKGYSHLKPQLDTTNFEIGRMDGVVAVFCEKGSGKKDDLIDPQDQENSYSI